MENAQGLALVTASAIKQLRTITGIAASIFLGVSVSRSFALPLVGGLAFGGAWGIVLLYAVQLRGLVQGDRSASWSGVIIASLIYIVSATFVFLGVSKIPVVLDLSTPPLGAIYIAAKLGCHRIGCCNWKSTLRPHLLSLPLIEAIFTVVILIFVFMSSRALQVAGAAFCLFSILHVSSWLIVKGMRDNDK